MSRLRLLVILVPLCTAVGCADTAAPDRSFAGGPDATATAAVAPPVDWGAAASEVMRDVAHRAERSGAGARWLIAEYLDGVNVSYGYSSDFYTGAAGILFFLAKYYLEHPSEELAALIREGAQFVAAAAVDTSAAPAGLHVGLAGHGRMFLALDEAFPGEGWRDQARAIAARLPEGSTDLDVISGAAGEGLFLLELHAVDGDERWLRSAVARADRLLAAAVAEGAGAKWPLAIGSEYYYPGISHGTAGIGYFLARLAGALGDRGLAYRKGAVQAATWLAEIAVRRDGNLSWYRRQPDQTAEFQDQWCHGTGGIALFFVELWRLTGEARYLETAISAGETIMALGSHWSPCVCHGNAGNAGVMLALYRATGDEVWRERAEQLAGYAWAARQEVDGFLRWESGDATGAMNPSFMVGAAGIGYVFLLMAAPATRDAAGWEFV
ncbi:MAG: hypothetical protein HYV63_31625 [Candidatus Schekmanbacteria bacterium]|nr:hypothetical protein [Candidatus Schekmanbacteria bacterium]